MQILRALGLFALLGLAVATGVCRAADSVTGSVVKIKLVTLAPTGSTPYLALLRLAEKWEKISSGQVKLTVIGSYRAGGEAAIIDKMGVGGIDASLITASGLIHINRAAAGLNSIPLVYRNLEEVDYVMERLGPELAQGMEQKGYKILCWTDVGWTRFFSVAPMVHPADLKRMKVFVWSGFFDQLELMKEWGTTPVPLEPNDILSGLTTGIIDAIPSPPFAANAAQFSSVAKHMLTINWGPFVGGVVIRSKSWEKVPPQLRDALLAAAAETGREIRRDGRRENDEAVAVMQKKQGLQIHTPTPKEQEEWQQAMARIFPKIRGNLVPAETFDRVESLLKEYRGSKKN
jgi:TRAP-type C4-dicarboxylate transport system substrate-binding protein